MGDGASVRHLTIYRLYFTKSDCYKSGTRQKSVGVQVHSTGANNPYLRRYVQPDDGRLGKHKYLNSHNRSGVDVCASAYIGRLADDTVAVYQTLPWDMRCWISGKGRNGNANRLGFIGYEICEDSLEDESYFKQAVMETAVNLTAHLCQIMGTTPDTVVKRFEDRDVLAVMDHSELSSRGLASGHSDISHWLRRYGKRMSDFREAVQAAMNEGVEVTYVDALDSMQGEWTEMSGTYEVFAENGGYVNLRELPDTQSKSLEKLYNGNRVTVTTMSSIWCKCETENNVGYVMTEFLREIKDEILPPAEENIIIPSGKPVIIDSEGNRFEPVGNWRVEWSA